MLIKLLLNYNFNVLHLLPEERDDMIRWIRKVKLTTKMV